MKFHAGLNQRAYRRDQRRTVALDRSFKIERLTGRQDRNAVATNVPAQDDGIAGLDLKR